MTAEKLKAEVRDAAPEVREELFTLLCVLRRAQEPGRAADLTARLNDPARWIPEDEAARRLAFTGGELTRSCTSAKLPP